MEKIPFYLLLLIILTSCNVNNNAPALKYNTKEEVINMSETHKEIAAENYSFLTKDLYEKRIEDNIKILPALSEAGNNPAIEREVEHFIYFNDVLDMNSFSSEAAEMGYPYKPTVQQPGLLVKTILITDEIKIHAITLPPIIFQ